MLRTILAWSSILLLTAAPFATAQDDWEMSEDLKNRACPPGTRPDGKGFCLPDDKAPPDAVQKPPAAPEAAPKPAPAPTTQAAPKPAPAPATKPAPPPAPPRTPGPSPTPRAKPEPKPAPGPKAAPAPNPDSPAKADQPKPGEQPEPGEAAGVDEQAQKEASADEAAEDKPEFIKGELWALLGTSKLVTKNNRVGVRIGWEQIDLVQYLTINPELDLRFGDFSFGLGIPLALEMYDGNLADGDGWKQGFDDIGAFRKQDWDEWQEYARFLRYLTYGRKEDNIYLNLSQVGSNTLGHGALLRRYSVNIDPDSTRVSGQFDMYNDYVGFELTTNSILSWDVFGVLGFVKPLSFFSDNPIARSLSIGFTYAADRAAPVRLKTKPAEGASPPQPFFVLGDARPAVDSDAWLHAMGVDMEIKLVKTDHLDFKPFFDFSWMMPGDPSGDEVTDKPSGGNAFTAGVLGRLNFGADPVHAMRVIAEFRTFSSTYLPGYFDTFYELQKYVMHQHYGDYGRAVCPDQAAYQDNDCLPPTKFTEIFVNRKGGPRRYGFYTEFNYSVVGYMSLTLALEGSNAPHGSHFLAHLEVPALSWLQFFVTFHQRSMEGLGDLFSRTAADKILFSAVRLRLLPFLFVNFRYFHSLMLREGNADLNGDGLENAYRIYEPHHAWMGDIEFGWEF